MAEDTQGQSDDHRKEDESRQRTTDERPRSRTITISLDDLDDVEGAVRDALGKGRDAAASVGGSIRDSIRAARATRDRVVMVRVSKEALDKLDELVDSGVTNSRSEAAAFLIGEGIEARGDLFGKIAEETRVIREARERLRKMLDDDGGDG